MSRLLFYLFLLLPSAVMSQKTDTLIYSIVAAGRTQGFDKFWKNSDGSYGEWYQFNDRGRGDSLRVTFRENDQGFPTYIKAGGVDYMKNPVFEEFSLTNGKARWKNNVENEERAVAGNLFFVGLKSGGGHMFRALHANNGKIRLLPYGELQMNLISEHQVKKGDQSQKLRLVEIKGLGFTPGYFWIDETYEQFAYLSDWQSIIIQGYEHAIDELLQVQKDTESAFFGKLANSIPQPVDEWMLIKEVRVFDSRNAKLLPAKDILIHNGVIQKIGASNTIMQKGARVIDGKGKTVLPGLWDMHTHISENLEGILHLASGVTHVRDMGNGANLIDRIEQFNSGSIIGPRIEIMSGFIDGKDPMAAPTGVHVANIEEGKKAIREFAAKGYQQIKLYSSIKPEWVAPLAEEAHRNNMRVCGHIPAFMTATQAIAAGYDEITHLNMLALNFFGDTIDTRIPLRFSVPARRTASLDLNGREMKAFVELLKEKNTAVDPTLGVFEGLFTAREGQLPARYKNIVDHFPLSTQRRLKGGGGGLPVPQGMDETYKKSFEAFKKITRLLYDSGITILPGTDGFAGFDLLRELELYVQAGIPAAKVLQIATWGPASYTGMSAEWGEIAEGRKADLVLVNGDPVANISDIRNTKLVITNGRIYDPAKLYGAISVKPF